MTIDLNELCVLCVLRGEFMKKALALALAGAALTACQSAPVTAPGPAPRACGLAEFGEAPGRVLPPPERPAAKPSKSAPLRYAAPIPVNGGVGDLGRWVDAAPGWKAWRLWLRSDEARSVSVHLKPLSLPPGAELWLCSPDGTTRQGPILGKGPGDSGQFWSPSVAGPELWLEVLTPAGAVGDVRLIVAEAFAAFR